MRRFLLLVPVVALFVVGGIGLFRARPQAELGRRAPDFTLPDLAQPDRRIRLGALAGRPVVLNFWASWCEPCKDEAPVLARFAREHGNTVTFLGVSILDGREEGLAFAKRYGIRYSSVRDARGIVAKRYAVTGVPETVFIDSSGRYVGKYIGAFDRPTLERLLRQLRTLPEGRVLRITGRGETRPVP